MLEFSKAAIVFTTLMCTAAKCDPYDPALDPQGSDSMGPVECADRRTAEILVENFAYNILCGCEEVEGRVCTIAPGMTVVWRFADATEHNVSSVASAFGMSSDTLAGSFDFAFPDPGEFEYGCTIHPNDMSGYRIVVVGEE